LRETLFNVIAQRIPDANILDGFAGTGAIGIEALSRGAAHVTFVDPDPRAVNLIRENLQRCGIADRATVVDARFTEVSGHLARAPFDVIVLDPPYNEADFPGVIQAAVSGDSALTFYQLQPSRKERPATHGR
jgi:16S rRNA (guanine966-N2)-methyltransferase